MNSLDIKHIHIYTKQSVNLTLSNEIGSQEWDGNSALEKLFLADVT